jgi:hypothetical protein
VTLLVAHDESLAVEESDSAGDDDEEHAADAKAQLRAHYKPSQTHILRNIAPLLYPRASPAQVPSHPLARATPVQFVLNLVGRVSLVRR